MPKRPGGKKPSGLDDATLSASPAFSPSGQGFADSRNKLPPWKQRWPRCRTLIMVRNHPDEDLFYSTGVQQSSILNCKLCTRDFFATKVAYTRRWRSEPYPIFSSAQKWQKMRLPPRKTPDRAPYHTGKRGSFPIKYYLKYSEDFYKGSTNP